MSKRVLERYWNGNPADLRKHPVVAGAFEEIQSDIRAGRVFPALRENEIHLYHEGGRVLRIRPRSVYTHRQYAEGCGDGETSVGLSSSKYREIKERCQEHNRKKLKTNEPKELWIVSRLFKRFSVWSDEADPIEPKLIDIEVRLRRDQSNDSQMIDLLFLGDGGRLTFVEVKRQYDSRVRSRGIPAVVEKVSEYEEILSGKEDTVVRAYTEVSHVLCTAFGLRPFENPTTLSGRVPILVCRRDAGVGKDIWLQERLSLCAKDEIHSRDLVVDGGATSEGAYRDEAHHPSWCGNGLWKNLSLKMVFDKIDGLAQTSRV